MGGEIVAKDRIYTEEKLEERLSAVNSYGQRLNAANSLENVYELVLDAMQQTLGFEYAEFLVNRRGMLQVAGHRGFPEPTCELPLDGKKA